MRAAVETWVELGAERALTGPIARGDEATVARQRAAVARAHAGARAAVRRARRRHAGAGPDGGGGVITIRTKAEMHAHTAAARAAGRRIGLVPTMGAFHAGHHALMRAAREACDEVVVSLFVNPAQFDEAADLAAYPRTEERDAAEAAELGVDVLFAPSPEEVYPAGFATSVRVEGLSDVLEGAERGPGHFAGVCTVVAKLLNVVAPDVAYFGQKDAQQVAVAAADGAPTSTCRSRSRSSPTVREPDGLAMSSRNVRLDAGERERAVGPEPRAARRRGARSARASATPRACARPRWPRWPRSASSPSTSRSSTPTPSRPSTPSTAACSSPWPRGSATPD